MGAQPRHDVRDSLGAAVPSAEVRSAADDDRFTFESLELFVSIIRIVLLAFAGVAVLVGAFTIFNSLSITVAQRTKEFGLLRMVGATRRQVRFGVLLEALLVGLLASGGGHRRRRRARRRPQRGLRRARPGPAGRRAWSSRRARSWCRCWWAR